MTTFKRRNVDAAKANSPSLRQKVARSNGSFSRRSFLGKGLAVGASAAAEQEPYNAGAMPIRGSKSPHCFDHSANED